MFILKTIKLPNLFKEKRHTSRGRVYYRKRSFLKTIMWIVKLMAIIWLGMYASVIFKEDKMQFYPI